MDCKKFEEEYPVFLYDEVSEEEGLPYKKHIDICDKCRKVYEDGLKIKLLFDNMEDHEPEEYIMDKIREKAMNYNAPSALQWNFGRMKIAFSFIFILVLIIGTAYIRKNLNINNNQPVYNETGNLIDSTIKNLEYKTRDFSYNGEIFGLKEKENLWESSSMDQKMADLEIEVKIMKKNFEDF